MLLLMISVTDTARIAIPTLEILSVVTSDVCETLYQRLQRSGLKVNWEMVLQAAGEAAGTVVRAARGIPDGPTQGTDSYETEFHSLGDGPAAHRRRSRLLSSGRQSGSRLVVLSLFPGLRIDQRHRAA